MAGPESLGAADATKTPAAGRRAGFKRKRAGMRLTRRRATDGQGGLASRHPGKWRSERHGPVCHDRSRHPTAPLPAATSKIPATRPPIRHPTRPHPKKGTDPKGVILLFRKRGQSQNQNDPFSSHCDHSCTMSITVCSQQPLPDHAEFSPSGKLERLKTCRNPPPKPTMSSFFGSRFPKILCLNRWPNRSGFPLFFRCLLSQGPNSRVTCPIFP